MKHGDIFFFDQSRVCNKENDIITSDKWSNDPDTGYALIINFATEGMLRNPFQIQVKRDKKVDSSSAVSVILKGSELKHGS